jgi:peptide/nickel transport system substrate-binding protein
MNINRRSVMQLMGGASAAAMLPAATMRGARAATGTVVVAIEEAPKQLDPLRYLTNPGYRTIYNIFDTLIGVDYRANGKLIPGLATSWRRINDRTVEVKLRENVSFHDGTKMTADDVVFSFSAERINTKGTPGYANAQQHLSTIDRAEATAPDTVRIVSRDADPVLEQRLSAWGAQIISKAAFQKAGWDGFAQKPIGTGPYSVTSLGADEVRLKAFAGHWAGEPSIDTLVFRGVPELSARIAGLTSGDFQLIADVPPDQFPAVTRSSNLDIVGGPIASMRVVKFDTRNPQLKDPRVRQALTLAVDRDAIVKSLWAGRVDVPRGHQLESYGEFYNANYPAYQYNPTKARELLAAAGYAGQPIPYRIRVNAYGAEVATAQVLVAMWKQVGVNIDLQIKETFGQLLEFPGTGMRNGADPVLVNDPLFGIWRSYNEAERDVWSNEQFYKLGHQLETEMNPAERRRAFQGMVEIFDQDPPAIILHRFGVFYAKVKNLKWDAYPHVYMDFRRGVASL